MDSLYSLTADLDDLGSSAVSFQCRCVLVDVLKGQKLIYKTWAKANMHDADRDEDRGDETRDDGKLTTHIIMMGGYIYGMMIAEVEARKD